MGNARGEVLVFGSINTDLVVYVPRLPHPGETVSGGSFAVFPGGKGANSAVAASRSGAAVRMHGAVGDDGFGAERIRSLRDEGIDTSGIAVKSGTHSGVAQIWVDGRGENSIAVAPGANALFQALDVAMLAPPSAHGSVASFQNEIPQAATEALLGACKRLGYVTMWNIAPECRVKPAPATLRDADYLILNENEIRAFLGLAGQRVPGGGGRLDAAAAEVLARALVGLGARNVVVTLGPNGSIWLPEGSAAAVHQRPFEVEAVDSVGAGDCFCGVLAASIASGLAPEAALERAAAAAAISVTRRGAQTSMPRAEEIDELVRTRGMRAGH